MKKVFLFFCICICMFFQSCQSGEIEANTEDIKDEVNADPEGMLLDGGEISDISLYCIENNKSMIGEQWYEYYPKTKTVTDYDSFKLYLILNRNASVYTSDNKEEMASIGKIESEYQKERSTFISVSYRKYRQNNDIDWPVLFTAFVNGDLTITCDKLLFGEQPGTNLLSYFTVFSDSPCVPMGIEDPQFLYNFGEDRPTDASKLFQKESWLQPEYHLEFSKQPSEKYEELTFSISLPMTIEHTRDIAVSKYRGQEVSQKYTEAVYTSKCQIKFNWK